MSVLVLPSYRGRVCHHGARLTAANRDAIADNWLVEIKCFDPTASKELRMSALISEGRSSHGEWRAWASDGSRHRSLGQRGSFKLISGHQLSAARSSLSAPRATIFRASSGNGRCDALASSHGTRIQTSRSAPSSGSPALILDGSVRRSHSTGGRWKRGASSPSFGVQSHSISLELVSTDGSEQTSSPSLLTVQPESVPDPKTPAAQDVAVNDRKIPKISPAINFNMTTPC